MISLFLTAILTSILVNFSSCDDVFSSMATLEHVLSQKEEWLSVAQRYLVREKKRLDKLSREIKYLKASTAPPPSVEHGKALLELSSQVSTRGPEMDQLKHPVTAYKVLSSWVAAISAIEDNSSVRMFRTESKEHEFVLPDKQDSTGAGEALLRLQRIYNIPTQDMAFGNIQGSQGMRLDPNDFYNIAGLAAKSKDLGLAAQWMEMALDQNEAHSDFTNKEAYFRLAKLLYRIGDYENALRAIETAKMLDPSDKMISTTASQLKVANRTLHIEHAGIPEFTALTWQRSSPESKRNYEMLCRGQDPDVGQTRLGVMCRFRQTDIPYVVYKEEILSRDPYVAMIYDVINDREAEAIIGQARPSVELKAGPMMQLATGALCIEGRATVANKGSMTASSIRVSKVAWLGDGRHNGTAERLSRRVSQVTGLETMMHKDYWTAEAFQVVNYGIGGQYEPHFDFMQEHLKRDHARLQAAGDRTATFLIYLNEVEAGGATVFPEIGLRIPAIKNAASFWYNLRRSGDVDRDTLHAGCPVLLGEKWVTNKWIREAGAFPGRLCGWTKDAADDL